MRLPRLRTVHSPTLRAPKLPRRKLLVSFASVPLVLLESLLRVNRLKPYSSSLISASLSTMHNLLSCSHPMTFTSPQLVLSERGGVLLGRARGTDLLTLAPRRSRRRRWQLFKGRRWTDERLPSRLPSMLKTETKLEKTVRKLKVVLPLRPPLLRHNVHESHCFFHHEFAFNYILIHISGCALPLISQTLTMLPFHPLACFSYFFIPDWCLHVATELPKRRDCILLIDFRSAAVTESITRRSSPPTAWPIQKMTICPTSSLQRL